MTALEALRLITKLPDIRSLCARRLRLAGAVNQRRNVTLQHWQPVSEAEHLWAEEAEHIKAGSQESMVTMLEKRGYIHQIVGDRGDLDRLMTEKRVGMYVGVDPTASSMHVGHLLPLMVLYWAYIKGYYACSLLGGATAQIGDPIGRTESRQDQSSSVRKVYRDNIRRQLNFMWFNADQLTKRHGHERITAWTWRRDVVSNRGWLNKLSIIEILKDLGRGVRIGTMLGRDSVKNRMGKGEGMSFAEFSYPLLQSWDWWHLYKTEGVQIQVGGADQFGNILAGVDAVNYMRQTHLINGTELDEKEATEQKGLLNKPMGFTVPLLTTKSGEKFGKSEGNAIWLNRTMTSPFDLYQFFLRVSDADVHRYLKLFTFKPLDVLEDIMKEHVNEPSKRVAQHTLAHEVLALVHGPAEAKGTEREHRSLFERKALSAGESGLSGIDTLVDTGAPSQSHGKTLGPSVTLPRSLIYNQSMDKILCSAGLATSRSEGSRMIAQKGVYLGARPNISGATIDHIEFSVARKENGSETEKHVIEGNTLILRFGKSKVRIINIISDEDFTARGLSVPA